jgi:hypothetical protein
MGARLNRALSRIPDEFKDQPMYRQLMTAIVNRMEETDTIIADLATMRWIDSAEGVWLDTVGEIIGIPRFYEPLTEGIFTYRDMGLQAVLDHDMNEPDLDDWTIYRSAILSKEVAPNPYEGNQFLRITRGVQSTPGAIQSISSASGKLWQFIVRMRGDGVNSIPYLLLDNLDILATGTVSSEWQYYTAERTVTGNFSLYLRMQIGTNYVDFDLMSAREISPNDPTLGYSGITPSVSGGIYNSVNGLFSDTLIDDDTYRRYIKAKAKATGTPGTLADIYTFIKEAFVVESIVTTSGTRQTTVQLVDPLTQGQKLQLKRWAPVSAAVSIRILDP